MRLVRILCNQAAIALENARVYGRVEQMAATDALTGLFNRRYFQQALDREMSRADRSASSIALPAPGYRSLQGPERYIRGMPWVTRC